MPKKQKPDARLSELKESFISRVGELWEEHEKEFMQVLDDSESNKVNLTFTASLDFSESAAKLSTGVRFSMVFKDSREDTFDDPNQPTLAGMPEKEKKKRGKKTEATEKEDES